MSRKRVPLEKILQALESGVDISDLEITLFPPEDGNITEEESGDEAENDFNHLPGSVLRTEVEVQGVQTDQENSQVIESGTDISEPEDDPEFVPVPAEDEASTSNRPQGKKRKFQPKKKKVSWLNDENLFIKKAALGDSSEVTKDYAGPVLSHMQCFEKMFSCSVFELLVEMSNTYAGYNNHSLDVSVNEMKVFIGIIMLTGYLKPKYMRMFWEEQSDTYNKLVAQSIRRDRFFEIQKYLHLCDNYNLSPSDKFSKVRTYFNLLNKNYLEGFEIAFSSHLAIDESMVPYFGHHGSKQHIKGKPIRFGYKLWSVATRNGYLISFEPYQGSKSSPLPLQDEYGLGASVVLELSSRLPSSLGPYNFYIDNFFTGLPLLRLMNKKGLGCTGTIRDNRIEKCPLPSVNDMKKMPRGSYSIRNTDDMCLVRWNDNNIVTIASNCHGTTPINKVDRIGFIDKKKKKISVKCPNVISKYNCYMGGVDRFDENLGSLRCSLKGRKWWYPLFIFGIDSACQNAWLLRKKTAREDITYCNFRRAVVQEYCFKYGTLPKRSTSISNVPKPTKTLPSQPASAHEKVSCGQRRCRKCHKNTRFMCRACGVGLHVHCWFAYHESLH